MKKILLIFSSLFCIQLASAQSYTWAENTACIFYTNCTKCHFPGGPAPFSLIDYASAFTNRFAIKQAVLDNYMPPWQPDENYQTYAHERLLTQPEKDIIVAWVDQGGVQGNLANAPTPPSFSSSGSQLSQIDFSGGVGNYTNTALTDDYRCFLVPTHFTTDQNISEIEIIPGNKTMVHHVLIYSETDTNGLIALDNADTGMGYSDFGGTGLNTSNLLAAWVPGSDPYVFPTGMGVKVTAGSYLVLQIHYPEGTDGDTDTNTVINFKYASGSIREVRLDAILNHITNISPSSINIPANSTASYTESFTLPSVSPLVDNFTFINIFPHMHKVGVSIKSYAIKPGNDTVPLIDIPNWDFHWQGTYAFRQPMVFPEGTVLKAEAFYDNTTANINAPNPNNPVTAGEATTDEMMIVFFGWLYAFPGDANIIVDTVTVKPMYNGCQFVGIEDVANTYANFKIYPNPSGNFVNISFEQFEAGDVKISLVDISGKVLAEYIQPDVEQGSFLKTIDVQSIPAGMYYLKIWNGNEQFSKPVIVVR